MVSFDRVTLCVCSECYHKIQTQLKDAVCFSMVCHPDLRDYDGDCTEDSHYFQCPHSKFLYHLNIPVIRYLDVHLNIPVIRYLDVQAVYIKLTNIVRRDFLRVTGGEKPLDYFYIK